MFELIQKFSGGDKIDDGDEECVGMINSHKFDSFKYRDIIWCSKIIESSTSI